MNSEAPSMNDDSPLAATRSPGRSARNGSAE